MSSGTPPPAAAATTAAAAAGGSPADGGDNTVDAAAREPPVATVSATVSVSHGASHEDGFVRSTIPSPSKPVDPVGDVGVDPTVSSCQKE